MFFTKVRRVVIIPSSKMVICYIFPIFFFSFKFATPKSNRAFLKFKIGATSPIYLISITGAALHIYLIFPLLPIFFAATSPIRHDKASVMTLFNHLFIRLPQNTFSWLKICATLSISFSPPKFSISSLNAIYLLG